MMSSPRSSGATDVVDPPGIPAARRCGGGVGEIPAGLRQAGAGGSGGGMWQQGRDVLILGVPPLLLL